MKANHKRLVEEEKDSTFFQLRPKLPYDIFHQKGAALPVAPNMLLSWLLTKRECSGECDEGVKAQLCVALIQCSVASDRLTFIHTESMSQSNNKVLKKTSSASSTSTHQYTHTMYTSRTVRHIRVNNHVTHSESMQ